MAVVTMSWVLFIQRKGEKMMVKQIDTEVKKKKAVVNVELATHNFGGQRLQHSSTLEKQVNVSC